MTALTMGEGLSEFKCCSTNAVM